MTQLISVCLLSACLLRCGSAEPHLADPQRTLPPHNGIEPPNEFDARSSPPGQDPRQILRQQQQQRQEAQRQESDIRYGHAMAKAMQKPPTNETNIMPPPAAVPPPASPAAPPAALQAVEGEGMQLEPSTLKAAGNYVLVCACTRTVRHSVFSPDERFQQLLASVESARQHVPGAAVVVVELSQLQPHERRELLAVADNLITFDGDKKLPTYRDGNKKGQGEAYGLIKAVGLLKDMPYTSFIKLSGRYHFTPQFHLQQFNDPEHFCFKQFSPPRHANGEIFGDWGTRWQQCVETIAFSVPKKYEQLYINQLQNIITHDLGGEYTEIEQELMKGHHEKIKYVPELGVNGLWSDGGQIHKA